MLGGGTAGMTVVDEAAANGWEVAVVEAKALGGTCVNNGCIPTKTMIHSAKIMHYIQRAKEYGIECGSPRMDFTAVLARKDRLITAMRDGLYRDVAQNKKIMLFEGTAAFEEPMRVWAGSELIEGERILICTGARTLIPPIEGLDTVDYLTSTTALQMKELPASLIIAGGGPIAVEFAQMYARFGVNVTILQRPARLVPNVEPEISAELQRVLEQDGVNIITGADVRKVGRNLAGITVFAEVEGAPRQFASDRIMVATSRKPNSDTLQLDKAGVETDKRGYIRVDSAFRTNVPGIWALGDATGGAMFTHRAWHDGFLLSRYFFKGELISTAGRLIPYAIFTDPEIAAVGLGEQAAWGAGHDVTVLQTPFKHVSRAMAMAEEDGLIKLVVDGKNGKLLGAHLIGPNSGEIIHELVAAIRFNATVYDLQDMLHIHPTLAEGINAAAFS